MGVLFQCERLRSQKVKEEFEDILIENDTIRDIRTVRREMITTILSIDKNLNDVLIARM